jgi:protein TonB
MADTLDDRFSEFDDRGWSSRLRAIAVPGAILLAVGGVILYFLHDTAGIRREAPPLPTLIATLPPPPPPPPPKQPEIEKKVEEEQKPVEQPKSVDNAPKPVTINGPAQAGSDAFNVGSGSGDGNVGSGGGGFGEANYTRYLSSQLQQTIQSDDRLNHLVFAADMAVWVDPNGKLQHAKVLTTSGDPKLDQVLVEVLQEMPTLDEPPPSTLEFPQRIRVEGKRHV